jgi:hypothetical protein
MCLGCAIGCNKSKFSIPLQIFFWIHCLHDHALELLVILGGGGSGGLAAGGRDIVPMAHGLIEDRDRNLVVTIVVEDEEMPGHNLVPLA